MTTTYTPLYTTTLGSAASSVTINGFSSAYTDLVLVGVPKVTAATTFAIRFNSDSASNYSETIMYGDGSSATSTRLSNQTEMRITYGATSRNTNTSNFIVNIMNYSNTTTYKTVLSRENAASDGTGAIAGLWRKTPEAITSITIIPLSGGTIIDAGSTFSLYGVASTTALATVKATGGDSIVTSGGYTYHVFRSSGTFTPTQSISADVLCIAGGGGGGFSRGGGGGAGGLLGFTSQSLTAQGYTVTVGSGGAAGTGSGRGVNGNDSQFAALTLVKGGGGGGNSNFATPGNGGSGGGGAEGAAGGTATPSGQGYAGGAAEGANAAAGGGGGSGVAGFAGASGKGGNGGNGLSTYSSWGAATLTGEMVSGTTYYAGGGGGGTQDTWSALTSTGGYGGGGSGSRNTTIAGSTIPNTGGGGGGGGRTASPSAEGAGTNGASGLVIVRYAV